MSKVRRSQIALLVVATTALAFVPSSTRILGAVASASRNAGRAQSLLLSIEIARPDGPSLRGELASHAGGATRLEIRHAGGAVERHLRRGRAYAASRDRARIGRPRRLAPPFYLLQASSSATLREALASLGVATDEVELGHLEAHDCFVFGGRDRNDPRPSVWVDVETLELVRIDPALGEEIRFGPAKAFGELVVPGWIELRSGGAEPVRLTVLGAERSALPDSAFAEAWLSE